MTKKIILFILIAFSSFYGIAQEFNFSIKGEIKGLTDGSISVIYSGPNHSEFYPDTILVKDNKFHYKGVTSDIRLVFMMVNGLEDGKVKSYGFPIFIDDSPIKVTADLANLAAAKIEGSKLNKNYIALQENTTVFKKLQENERDIRIAGDNNELDRVAKLKIKRDSCVDNIITYLTSHSGYKDDLAAAFLIYEKVGRYLNGEKLTSVLDMFSPTIDKSVYFTYLRREVYMEKRLAKGQPAPNFILYDLEGKAHKLSDYRGQLVLLDFGASWCYWCKKEKPFLLDAHQKYSGKNLRIINVSMDKNRADWKKDIEKEKYPWLSISDLKAWSSDVAKDYNIKGIPNIMLIDKAGNIVGKNLRGEKINKAIEAAL